LTEDERFRTNHDRIRNRAALIDILTPILRARSPWFWLQRLQDAGVPSARFASFTQFQNDVHYRENAMVVDMDAPTGGTLSVAGAPWEFSDFDVPIVRGPRPGEHSDEYRAGRWTCDTLPRAGA